MTGRLPFLHYLFQSAVGHFSRTQNSFYLETKHRRPIIFPPCGHVIFSIFCVKQLTYANISRFTDCREPYIYFHFQSAFDKSTLLIDSIQWLFSAVCLALNSGEETATSNRCYLLYCFKLCLSNHAFMKQHILPGGLTGLKFIMKVWRAGGQVIILSKRSSLQLRSCLLLMNASLFNQPSSSKNLPFLIDTYKGAIVFLSSLPFGDPCSLKLY